jgi:hypothetical protein
MYAATRGSTNPVSSNAMAPRNFDEEPENWEAVIVKYSLFYYKNPTSKSFILIRA